MGVDAYLFAMKAKRYMNVDRYHNMEAHRLDTIGGGGFQHNLLLDKEKGIPGNDLELHLREVLHDGDRHGSDHWRGRARAFIAEFPGDNFFLMADNTDPSSHDVAVEGSYALWGRTCPVCHCPPDKPCMDEGLTPSSSDPGPRSADAVRGDPAYRHMRTETYRRHLYISSAFSNTKCVVQHLESGTFWARWYMLNSKVDEASVPGRWEQVKAQTRIDYVPLNS